MMLKSLPVVTAIDLLGFISLGSNRAPTEHELAMGWIEVSQASFSPQQDYTYFRMF